MELSKVGAWFTIENPYSSDLFRCSWFQRLSSSVSVRGAHIHQCAYYHQLPGALPYHFCKKDTAFYSNLPGISRLEKLCPGVGPDHIHERAWGSRRVGEKTISLAAAAGTYPVQLCEVLAQVVFEQLDSDRLQFRHGRRTSKDTNGVQAGTFQTA